MIKKDTVLILGAGASIPYGYPSGAGLRNRLLDPNLFSSLLVKKWFSNLDVDFFCSRFLRSQMTSIDMFLSRCGQELTPDNKMTLEEIGKLGISIALRENQNLARLLKDPNRHDPIPDLEPDHWYQYLWNQLTVGIKPSNLNEFSKQRLTIVTFNYDFSLECYLLTAMENTYSLDHNKAREHLKGIKIIHLYGNLSGNPMDVLFSTAPFDYDKLESWPAYDLDRKSLRVIDELRDEQLGAPFEEAFNSFVAAEAICFLGFGFDKVNLERLRISDALAQRYKVSTEKRSGQWAPSISATLLALKDAEIESASRSILQALLDSGLTKSAATYKKFVEEFAQYPNCKSEALLRATGLLI